MNKDRCNVIAVLVTTSSFCMREAFVAPCRVAPNLRLRAFGRIERAAVENAARAEPSMHEAPRTNTSRPVASPATRPTVARPLIFFANPPDEYHEN